MQQWNSKMLFAGKAAASQLPQIYSVEFYTFGFLNRRTAKFNFLMLKMYNQNTSAAQNQGQRSSFRFLQKKVNYQNTN